MWGVLEKDNTEEFHIAPVIAVDGEGFLRADHQLSPDCPCHPRLEETEGSLPMWVHNDEDADEPERKSEAAIVQ